jgi:hypothetical protein
VNETTAGFPGFLALGWEKQTIAGFHLENTPEGYRLTFMMIDADTVAVARRACGPGYRKRDGAQVIIRLSWRGPRSAF